VKTTVSGLRARIGPGTIVLALAPPIVRADIRTLCLSIQDVLERHPGDAVICDVGALVDPDAVTVDALARLQLTARRSGSCVSFRNAHVQLRALLALTGLTDVVCGDYGSALESGGEAEEGEYALGVEEEADPGNPAP
jgi:ABC-type transporter Mla MlaB component